MIIDAHQHVWNLDVAEYSWLDAGAAPIDRTIELDEALPSMAREGVTGTVLVQAADNAEDTANMIRVANEHPEVIGIVAWVPLDDPDVAEQMLGALRADRRVVGVRNLLHAKPDPDWVLRSEVDAGLGLLESAGATFDYVTGGPAALSHLPTLSERHPDLTFVIDHLGKPPIGGTAAQRTEWYGLIAAAAENPRVSAKVSGLYETSGALDSWTIEQIRPFVADALDLFGPNRLMVGGDWPISVLAGGYDRTWDTLKTLAGSLDAPARDALLGGTAASVYGLAIVP